MDIAVSSWSWWTAPARPSAETHGGPPGFSRGSSERFCERFSERFSRGSSEGFRWRARRGTSSAHALRGMRFGHASACRRTVTHRAHRPEEHRVEHRQGDPKALQWQRTRLARARTGDRQAFAELYRAFAPELYHRVLLPKLGDAQAAEDALSETFRTLLERIHTLQIEKGSLWFWLCRVASNKAMDMHRVKGRTRRALSNFERLLRPLREGACLGGDALGAAEAVDAMDALGAMETEQERARVQALVGHVLEQLNPRYKLAIELRFMQDKSREQCAQAMEVKLGTFDVILLRALRAFRSVWERQSIALTGEKGVG